MVNQLGTRVSLTSGAKFAGVGVGFPLLLLLMVSWAWAQTPATKAPVAPADAAEQVHNPAFHTTKPLELEAVGLSSVKAWYRPLDPGRANDQSPWKQLIWFKKDSRTTQKSYFALVDFAQGTVKELPTMIPSYEPWANAWVNGKLYIGTNLPPRLAVFDPATDTLTDLGEPFSGKSMTVYRMEVAPDGVLALGGGTGSDVSLFDPKTNQFTKLGQVASEPGGGTYAYYLSIDDKYIYVAVRSSKPWELLRIDRQTHERKVLLTAPPQGMLTVGNPMVEQIIPDSTGKNVKKWYYLRNGEIAEWDTNTPRPAAWSIPGPGFAKGSPPELAIDLEPIVQGKDALTVHYQTPDKSQWKQAPLPIRPDVSPLRQLIAMEDGRIVGLPNAYFAMVIVDPKTGDTQRVPMHVSAYSLASVGKDIFISGYPSVVTYRFDTTRPMTWEDTLPNRPGLKSTDPKANPHQMGAFGQYAGKAHTGLYLTPTADGKVHMIARRHRYFRGFSLMSFDAKPAPDGQYVPQVYDDQGAFDHLQLSSMRAYNDGKQLLIGSQLEDNPHLQTPKPDSAALFVYDVMQKKIVGKYQPIPKATSIEDAIMISQDVAVGYARSEERKNVFTVFRYNLKTSQLEAIRHYNWSLDGDMKLMADGKIWGTTWYGNFGVLFEMDPVQLTVKGLGQFPAHAERMVISQGQLYLSGFPQVTRVKGLPLPQAPAPKP